MSDAKKPRMKTAYELALERLEGEGIAPPSRASLSPETREKIAEVRRRAEARLAELQIHFQKKRREIEDPLELAQAEEEYQIDRRRIEDRREREIAKLRGGR